MKLIKADLWNRGWH